VKVIFSGYNVETEQLKKLNPDSNLSPEIFSAAYARISRSHKSIEKLREIARKDLSKARSSNKQIIFEMGHHSVAEHAVYNIDIIGISRLAMEELEKFRLVSYTEKSQRYVTLKGDFTLPEEIRNDPVQELFMDTITIQNNFYKKSYEILKKYTFEKFPELAKTKDNKRLLEGLAKEDARYILSLATQSQAGLTINARNLEYLFRKLSLSKFHEVSQLGQIMYDQAMKITPSIILFPEPSAFEQDIEQKQIFNNLPRAIRTSSENNFEILNYTREGDNKILSAMLVNRSSLQHSQAVNYINNLSRENKTNLFRDFFSNMEFFDKPPREFEIPFITFQAIVSASNFAQLKRHRMATLIENRYRIKYGNTIPKSIIDTGLDREFSEIIKITNRTHNRIKEIDRNAADYILTNSHKRLVIMKMNLRELYHFVRLRQDEHAQWDIRELADKIALKASELFPLSTELLCGKSDFNQKFKTIYNRAPKFSL
jgi:flavin-dependent thymidylate synthase